LFGFDVELAKTSADGSGEPTKMSISRTIEIIIYEDEETLPSLTPEVFIDDGVNINKIFTLNKTP